MSPAQFVEPIPLTPALSPDGSIDEDLYCLECGYNLRGLSGDPIRCPECGARNDLGTIAIPAIYIQKALREMETAPTGCVASAFAGATCGAVAWLVGEIDFALWSTAIVGILVATWCATYIAMRNTYEDQPGWRRILGDFHLATLFCTVVIPLSVLALWAVDRLHPSTGFGPVCAGVVTVSVPCLVVGLRVYAAARKRIAVMQRDAAVRMAREILGRELRRARQ